MNSKKGQVKKIVGWIIALLVLAVLSYFIWKYLVHGGMQQGFGPIINETLNKSASVRNRLG